MKNNGYITDDQHELARQFTIGGKARNLYRLKELGMNVPSWIVIPQETLLEFIPEEKRFGSNAEVARFIAQMEIPESLLNELLRHFPLTDYFAVRSSAIDEDGSDFSFAGQFESELFVTKQNLGEKIKKVWISAFSDRVFQYRNTNNLKQSFGLAVIIQQMIPAEVAGVAFGINPVSGNRNEQLISAVFGLGEGLVSGELDADNFHVHGTEITRQLVPKTEQILLDTQQLSGTIKVPVPAEKQTISTLSDQQILQLKSILLTCAKTYGKPQDMEFAVYQDEIYLLQTRPITNLNRIPDLSGDYILWDNSNIIESYPGVTTPLTFSFISKSYEGAYKLFSRYLGVEQRVIDANERVFANTLGLINGRVYYNLKSWYHMLAMLPGYSINARFMENMMGVKERFDIPESYRLSKGKAWWSIVKMVFGMFARYQALPRKRKQFMVLLNTTISHYKRIPYAEKNANELMQLYLDFEKTLLNEWKAPLLNDFFAMIWFGRLQKTCQKYKVSSNPNIHNDLLCGSSDIISTQPIHRSIELATQISANAGLKAFFLENDASTVWKQLKTNTNLDFVAVRAEIERYIEDFGERCIGELKLETVSYTQDPTKFVKVLQSYVETGITAERTSGNTEETIRKNAEVEVKAALRGKWWKQRKLNKTIGKARELVSSRENLRYERTRAFGIVREIFSQMGNHFYSEGIIGNPRDIFYLTKEEIFHFIEGTSVTQNLQNLIDLRKAEFAGYQQQEPPSERFASYGAVYHANDFYSTARLEKIEGDLKGIGCCPGRVRAKVQVVRDPNEISSLNGDILVTSSTDPGWVTLFPSASAIIVERGSLLSHSAIVSREMGIPCIVGVTGLLKTLQTGDEIEMDGSTGEIKVILKVGEVEE
ncbi:MAG: phosphoenolpyruvate synthase [Candidatus Fluviicola riflensis]|nr:MAG: phosphoenolpyruvate synthase [Candidatus Fluviicola riflensis]OGS79724.1 MAG: phosphoenolpyruvate synthase [Candidatus Fluviicola riflensis]OGS87157.1 MAG: phosphoenolpyruvate synthase [Fluviicola sp. RIFCSPHIGHO2_01_FULL_43_53]OGS89945.1 MAG: phosphoenolpyruvate synthase [Fluviicola sp. RIFCSPHIGHO2_12_FULL_43_24]